MSDHEFMAPNPIPKLEEDQHVERILRFLSSAHSKLVVEVIPYDGRLDTNVVLDWIFNMENLFEFERTP